MTKMIFPHPEPLHKKLRIMPIFMPFSGCKNRCVYCSQTIQTGTAEGQLQNIYALLEQQLAKAADGAGYEIAFYGGTFTALPFAWQERFVSLAGKYMASGTVSGVRCSTRPDAINEQQLQQLRAVGLRTVELGVQSFDTTVLTKSKRNYSAKTIVSACNSVKSASLSLGVQLLPGLPGMDTDIFMQDIRSTCALAPDVVRLYPCLVFSGTVLASWYAKGQYAPWTLDETVTALGGGLAELWRHNIRVIRIGVAQEEGMQESLIAGPFHAAMGNMVRSQALRCLLMEQINKLNRKPTRLILPQRYQGEMWGYKGSHKAFWKAQGLTPQNVLHWNLPVFQLS